MEPLKGGKVTSDAELVRAAQKGDTTSLGLLLERYRAPLYGLALQILGHGPQAQDAVHETFLVALRKIDQVREPSSTGGWLHSVLRNVCRMQLREGHGEILFDEMPRFVERRFSEASAEEALDRLALRDWVWTALAELPETLRVTAMLRYFGSYASYEEIAAILGVPIGTVKSRLNQVKVKLAEALLETAGLTHGEARRLTESQTHFFEAAFGEYNRGQGCEILVSDFADDVVSVFPDGAVFRGREFLVRDFEGDIEAGMKLYVTNVIASKDITIVEGDFENPPDDPFHCPPAASLVCFYRDGKIPRAHFHFAPRPHWQDETISQKP
jgi:RNA polymerase sigma-70 factor (ECF subfamily)